MTFYVKSFLGLLIIQRQTVGGRSWKEASKFRWFLHMGVYALKYYGTV